MQQNMQLVLNSACNKTRSVSYLWQQIREQLTLRGFPGGDVMKNAAVICVALSLVAVSPIVAQETTGEILGVIASQDGMALPGVQVTVTNSEIGYSRSVLTQKDGGFRFSALRPSRYQVTAMLDGFQTAQRQVNVDLGRTAAANVRMEVGSFENTIEVTDAAPMVDFTSTVSGLSVNSDELLGSVPVQREVTNIALLAPGTHAPPSFWNQAGIYGLFTPEQGFASFSGSSIGENNYQVNGLNVSSFRHMLGATYVPM